MTRLCLLTIALLIGAGCSKSPIAVQDEASIAFESGRTQQAISILEQDWDHADYVIGNFLAFLYTREQYYNKVPDGYRKALGALQLIKVEPRSYRAVDIYLDLLRFNAMSHNGDTRSADDVMDKYCARTMEAADRRLCIRNNSVARVLLHLYDDPGHDTRFYKELLAITRAACIKTYGWDAILPREEVQSAAPRQLGPNNSFKPKPLRGSA